MSKKLRELLNAISTKKEQARNLVNENKVAEAKAALQEIKDLQAQAEMLAELEDDEEDDFKSKLSNGGAKEPASQSKLTATMAFINCFKAMAKKAPLPEDSLQVLNATTSMTEGVDEDGGLTVPQDIQTQIKELRRGEDALEEIVTVEPVTTLSGSRVIEKDAEGTPWDNVDEEADFPDVQGPQFEKLSYKVKKKGGILKITKELLSNTAENILAYIRKWIAKKSKVTRNFLILKLIEDNFGTSTDITGIDSLKDIFNVELDPSLALGAKVITNQDGFNHLDKLKDDDGNYILEKDPTNKTKRLLFGSYPIIVLSNKTLKTVAGKAPIYCGNFKEAITLFDRENMTIETSDQAGDMWSKDLLGMKVRERLDVQVLDEAAIVKGEITITP
jgi:HK97 family phage major capsid protein